MTRFLRRIACKFGGHIWFPYTYPHGDDWFGGPHERRQCMWCAEDEAL